MTEGEAIIVQKVPSAVARSRGRLTGTELARILKGSKRAEVLQDPLAATRSFGILSGVPHATLTGLLKALGRAGCTRGGTRPELTNLGSEVMWRRRTVRLDVAEVHERQRRTRDSGPGGATAELLTDSQQVTLTLLKSIRLEAAREQEIPAYRIAPNRVLEALVRSAPRSDPDAWLEVNGIGPKTVDAMIELFADALHTS